MVSNYYCRDCDRYINQKHTKSKAHLYIYYNIITNKYNIGDVYWCDFEKTIHDYMEENTNKVYIFSFVVRCNLNDEDICIHGDNREGYAPLYKIPDSGWICYKHCKSKKKHEIIYFIVVC